MKSLEGAALEWWAAVRAGADPIEALHEHHCGPPCWHWETLPEHEKEKLRKAPWNQ